MRAHYSLVPYQTETLRGHGTAEEEEDGLTVRRSGTLRHRAQLPQVKRLNSYLGLNNKRLMTAEPFPKLLFYTNSLRQHCGK